MSKFERLKPGLKDKWLDYFDQNKTWIEQFSCWNDDRFVSRPKSPFILAAISVLEPKLTPESIDYLTPLLTVNRDGEGVVIALGLNFDPRLELIKRHESREKDQEKLTKLFYTFLIINNEKYWEIIKNLTFIYSLILIAIEVKKCIDEINYLISIGEAIEEFGNSEKQENITPIAPPSLLDEYRQLLQLKEE